MTLDVLGDEINEDEEQAGLYAIDDELLPVEDERGEGHERDGGEELGRAD